MQASARRLTPQAPATRQVSQATSRPAPKAKPLQNTPSNRNVPNFAFEIITGKKIRQLRKFMGFSQTEFADFIGIGVQSVRRWEENPGPLSLQSSTFIILQKALRRLARKIQWENSK
jgi:DNA-binding transcriptional regulator YiaG